MSDPVEHTKRIMKETFVKGKEVLKMVDMDPWFLSMKKMVYRKWLLEETDNYVHVIWSVYAIYKRR